MGCGGYCVQGSGGLGAAVNKIRFCVWTFIAIAGPLVRIRLDARSDQPWRREGFRHPDLMIWGRANRARLVAACLTLCQAWASAGRPPAARSLGSFEAWSQPLGGILHVAGVAGFLGNLDEVMEASDSEGGTWRAFTRLWWDRFGSAEVSVSDLIGHAQFAQVGLPVSAKTDDALNITLGKAFRKLRDRAFRTSERLVHVRAAGHVHNSQRWKLEPAPEAPEKGGVRGGVGDVFYTSHARAHTRLIRGIRKNTPNSPLAGGRAVTRRPNSTGPPRASRTPKPGSDGVLRQEPHRRRPHHHHPHQETIMDLSTLPMSAALASRPPIISDCDIGAAPRRAVLALDFGTTTGRALRSGDGAITSGIMTFQPSRFEGGGMRLLRFRAWLTEVTHLAGALSQIAFEEVRAHAGTDAAHLYGGFLAHLSAWWEEQPSPTRAFPSARSNATRPARAMRIRRP